WSETDRKLPRIQFSAGGRVPALRVGAADRARRLVFQEGDLRMSAIRSIAVALCFALNAVAATIQERIDVAAAGETIRVLAGVHSGPIIIKKSLTLIGEPGTEIRGNGSGKVVTIAADDVTLRELRISGSGLQLSDDDAAVFVTGNRATIENCT